MTIIIIIMIIYLIFIFDSFFITNIEFNLISCIYDLSIIVLDCLLPLKLKLYIIYQFFLLNSIVLL